MTNTLIDGQEDLAASAGQEFDSTTTGPEKTLDNTESGNPTDHPDDMLSQPSEGEASQASTEASAPEASPAGKKSGSKKQKLPACQMIELERGNVYDEHPLAEAVREEFKIALRELPVGTITPAGLVGLAEHFPLRVVVLKDGKYYCIGGLRLYRLLRCDVPANTPLHVVLQEGLSAPQIKSHIYFDLLAMPIINCLNKNDRSALSSIWKTEEGSAFFNQAFGKDDSKGFAKILGCDPRTLKKEKIETPSS